MNTPMTSFRPHAKTAVLVGFLLSVYGCSAVRQTSRASARDRHQELLTAYVTALRSGDFSAVTFAPGISFEGPLSQGTLQGIATVRAFLERVATGAKDIRVDRFIIDGDTACIVATLETKNGTAVPFCEFVQFQGGKILKLRPYFDPRPLLAS
jgi:hypothetical protein